MIRFRDISIRHKLTVPLMGIVTLVLLFSSVAILVSHVRTIRAQMIEDYSTLADVVAANSAVALSIAEFDPVPTQEVVSDLAVDPTILFAAAYRVDREEVVEQPAPGGDVHVVAHSADLHRTGRLINQRLGSWPKPWSRSRESASPPPSRYRNRSRRSAPNRSA